MESKCINYNNLSSNRDSTFTCKPRLRISLLLNEGHDNRSPVTGYIDSPDVGPVSGSLIFPFAHHCCLKPDVTPETERKPPLLKETSSWHTPWAFTLRA
jgi:hypothetical protein